MLRSNKDLQLCKIEATDGLIGKVEDFYFDDDAWTVRYLVVEPGSWLSRREVLISPVSIQHPDWDTQTLPVSITKEQVRNSPGIDTDKPVSRQDEEDYMGYFGYSMYWRGDGMWGGGLYPYGLLPGFSGYGVDQVQRESELQAYMRAQGVRHHNDDPHLRSCKAVTGYHINAADGGIGHVTGFLIDDETWAIRYVIVDTSNWWLGHQVLIAPEWITGVHWSDKTVSVHVSRASVKAAPPYDAHAEWTRRYDLSLAEHYGRPGYWGGSTEIPMD